MASGNKSSTSLSRRSVDWRDSGIVIDDDHQFNSFDDDLTSGISSYLSSAGFQQQQQSPWSTASGILGTTNTSSVSGCCPTERIACDQDDDGDTILHLAVVGCRADKVRDLIKLCDINSINNMMQTPLHIAVLADRPEMVQLLMSSSARLDVHDRRGNTPLHLACQKGHQQIFEILLGNQPDKDIQRRIELTNFDGQTCLHLAATNDRRQLIQLLVGKYNANVNSRDSKSGETMLHKAISKLNVELVSLILGLDKHCNTADYSGRRPLDMIQVLKNSRIDQEKMNRLLEIEKLVRSRIELCIETGGCCTGLLDLTYVSSSEASSSSDYDE